MLSPSRTGTSLIEMLVALLLLDLLAITTLHSVLQVRRIAQGVAAGSHADVARLEAVRLAAAAVSCRDAASPALVPLTLPGVTHRPAVTVLLRCGR